MPPPEDRPPPPPGGVAAGLVRVLGAGSVLTAPADVAPYLVDHRRLYQGAALAVLLPHTVEDVARVLRLCNDLRLGVVPHGGNTSYCGGATPDESGSQVVLSLERLDRIRAVDPDNFSMTVEAGCVLAAVQRAADDAQRFFPLSLGSEGSCQIGGNLATNAGGLNVLRYGMTRDLVMGLEVVLADGRVLSSLSPLRKDNTGYDLRGLFVGSEGTLGVITAATLKLFPRPRSIACAWIAVRDVAAAIALLARVRAASGDVVSSFEIVPRVAVDLVTRMIPGIADPLPGATQWHVLCELSSSGTAPLEEVLTDALARATDDGLVLDAALAQNEQQRAALWRLRESVPEAQTRAGASLKHDISVPVTALPEFVARGAKLAAELAPEGYLVGYGHVGDGNLHFNLNQRAGAPKDAFLAREPVLKRAIHDLAAELGGSFSAEHGIGRLKVAELARYASPVELELMRAIKRALDPRGIMNPGKVLGPV